MGVLVLWFCFPAYFFSNGRPSEPFRPLLARDASFGRRFRRGSGFWFLVYVFWSMFSGFWIPVSGVWLMVYGLWFTVQGSGVWEGVRVRTGARDASLLRRFCRGF